MFISDAFAVEIEIIGIKSCQSVEDFNVLLESVMDGQKFI